MARRLARGVAAFGLVLLGVLAPTASADCDGPYPSFREVAPTAARIVYGDVVAVRPVEWGVGDGLTSRFTVRGWSLLEGVRPVTVDVDDVMSQPCAGYLIARMGDRVAIAFDGTAFSTAVEANAITWTVGAVPDRIGLEAMSEAELLELVALRPDALTAPVATSFDVPWGPLSVLVVVGLAGGFALARFVSRS